MSEMTEDRLRELEWAARYVIAHPPHKGYPCRSSCAYCKPLKEAQDKLTPKAMLEVIAEAKHRREQVGNIRAGVSK